MALANTPSSYGLIARVLHWLTALLIFVAFPLGYIANNTPLTDDAAVARVFALFSLHKTLGIAALLIGLARIGWNLSQPRPAPLGHARWELNLAQFTHWTLSIALVAVPLTGWLAHSATPGLAPIHWPLGQSLPFVPSTLEAASLLETLHWVVTKLLAAAIVLHVAGALKHAFIDHDATLARMSRGTRAGHGAHKGSPPAVFAALAIWIAALGLGAALTTEPPAPVEIWTAADVRVVLRSVDDGREVGVIPAADVTLALAGDNSGTLDVFAALDSISSSEADEFLAGLAIPVAQFTGSVAGTPPDLVATGSLDLGGLAEDARLTLIRSGDIVTLAGALALPGAPAFALYVEAKFERPAD